MNIPIGSSERHGIVRISEAVRRKHLALFGKSGVGKTTVIYNMAFTDLQQGGGFTVVDPHGGLIDDLLSVVPHNRTNDVILLDPRNRSRLLGINVFEDVGDEERPLVVSSVISIIRNLWPLNCGPRTTKPTDQSGSPRGSSGPLLPKHGSSHDGDYNTKVHRSVIQDEFSDSIGHSI